MFYKLDTVADTKQNIHSAHLLINLKYSTHYAISRHWHNGRTAVTTFAAMAKFSYKPLRKNQTVIKNVIKAVKIFRFNIMK